MALMPIRTKFRKMQKGQMAGFSKAANFLDFGEFGMQALERGWITTSKSKHAALRSHVISTAAVKCGSGFSLINLSLKNLLRHGWVKVKEMLIIGSLL